MEVETNRDPSPETVEEEQPQTITVTAEISTGEEIITVTTADILQQAATTILSQVNNNLITLPLNNNNNEEQKVKAVKGKRHVYSTSTM